jgi:hypothetical protein
MQNMPGSKIKERKEGILTTNYPLIPYQRSEFALRGAGKN